MKKVTTSYAFIHVFDSGNMVVSLKFLSTAMLLQIEVGKIVIEKLDYSHLFVSEGIPYNFPCVNMLFQCLLLQMLI